MPSKVSSIKIKRNEVSERGAARVNAFLAEILIRKSARNALLLAEASKKNAARKNVLNSYTKKTSLRCLKIVMMFYLWVLFSAFLKLETFKLS